MAAPWSCYPSKKFELLTTTLSDTRRIRDREPLLHTVFICCTESGRLTRLDHGSSSKLALMSEFARDRLAPAIDTPRAAEKLWRLRKDHHTLDADLRSHGEAHDVELQILCDGDLLLGQHHEVREHATAEAHALLQHYRANGWTVQDRRRRG